MLVLAGPGSGKTFVITKRIKALIDGGIDPGQILVVTFTNAAVREMKERFQELMQGDPQSAKVTFGTFHSIFFTILRYAYGYTGNDILREQERRQIVTESLKHHQAELMEEEDMVSGLITEIGFVKEERMDPAYYHSMNCPDEVFRAVYGDYERVLRANRKIDFEDMLVFAWELLSAREDIRAAWSRKFRYIMVDEFQDINPIQYQTLKLLAKPTNHLFCVGDDDQSIYHFRGARPEIMLGFEKDYPGCEKVVLEENYRSDGAILRAASCVIRNNRVRYAKEVKTHKSPGTPVERKVYPDCPREYEAIVRRILEYQKGGMPLSEMAILVRTNTQSRGILEKLAEYNIPFFSKERVPCLYDHWIVKNLLAYLKFANGIRERGIFLQIMNRPNRYIRREALTEPYVDFKDLFAYYEDKDWMEERLRSFQFDLQMLFGRDPYSAICYIEKKIGYGDFLDEYASARGIHAEDLHEILEEVKEGAKAFRTWQEWEAYMADYRAKLSEQQERSARDARKNDAVVVSTMHQAKGLEYTAVFLPDVNEGIVPYRKAVLDSDIEEERRMFYVALTRAKKFLHVYAVKERYSKEMELSRFFLEMGGEGPAEAKKRGPAEERSKPRR